MGISKMKAEDRSTGITLCDLEVRQVTGTLAGVDLSEYTQGKYQNVSVWVKFPPSLKKNRGPLWQRVLNYFGFGETWECISIETLRDKYEYFDDMIYDIEFDVTDSLTRYSNVSDFCVRLIVREERDDAGCRVIAAYAELWVNGWLNDTF